MSDRRPSTEKAPKHTYAWAWLSFSDVHAKRSFFNSFGNGSEFQYPIFHTRADALKWKKTGCGSPGLLDRVVKVYIAVAKA